MLKIQKDFNTDVMMITSYRHLVTDLMSVTLKRFTTQLCNLGPKELRNAVLPQYHEAPKDHFKRLYQIENFLKRYIFADDLYTQHELNERAKADFIASQSLFGLPNDNSPLVRQTLQRAKDICFSILGDFDLEEYASLCKWGKRAAKGLPARRSYLDVRVSRSTCTQAQLPWYRYFAATDSIFCRDVKEPRVVDSVKYTTVPKSFKAQRGIAPDVSFGGFLSQGLGLLIRDRLEAGTHINLATAQKIHKKIAQKASSDGSYATLDMSKASDSFTWDHIDKIVPDSWKEILKVVRVNNIEIDSKVIELKSYMLMGSGHTFPLQTVLFYSLAKAIVELMGSRQKVYVFGDDLLVPNFCAKPVIFILEKIGFTLNEDKSFHDGHFRESCGGDYYRGLDVRPAMPKGSMVSGSKRKYASFCFKVINSLLKRWSYHEIPNTIMYLCDCIRQSCNGKIPIGIAGIHAEDSCLLYEVPINTDSYKIVVKDQVYYVEQRILVRCHRLRRIQNEGPYYWSSLRNASVRDFTELEFETDEVTSRTALTYRGENAYEPSKGDGRLVWKRVRRNLTV